MDATANHLHDCLRKSDAAGGSGGGGLPLSFVVVVPGWTEGDSWSLLAASPYLRFKLVRTYADLGNASIKTPIRSTLSGFETGFETGFAAATLRRKKRPFGGLSDNAK